MSKSNPSEAHVANESKSRTKIEFDLADELTPEEIERFKQASAQAGSPTLTEHFLNLTLRHPAEQVA